MNTSAKTRIIAEGIALYAKLMDLTPAETPSSPEEKLWAQWVSRYPARWVGFVMAEQHALFDRVNAMPS